MTKKEAAEHYCPQEPRIILLENQYKTLMREDDELKQDLKELTKVVNDLCKKTSETLSVFNFLKWLMGILVACFSGLVVAILFEIIKVI